MSRKKSRSRKTPARRAAARGRGRAKAQPRARSVAGVKVPPEMQLVSVYLIAKDPDQLVAFYGKAFGFKKKFAMPGPDGKTLHAEVLHGDCTVMVGRENLEINAKAPSTVGGSPVFTYVYVKNVDALARQARAAGANIVQEPADQFYGDRTCMIIDPEGHRWGFAQHLRIVPPDQLHLPSA